MKETKVADKRRMLRLFFIGYIMGSSDLVPGVSGGTIAFISGIYQELVESIKHVTGKTIKQLFNLKVREAISDVPFAFFLPLLLGIFTAIFTLAKFLTYVLEVFPIPVWSYFFGLILASALMIKNKVRKWNLTSYSALVSSLVLGYMLAGFISVETPATLTAFFLSGALAITAMILPGISGSFLMIVIGKYTQLLQAVVERDFTILLTFGLGSIFGLALFSRVLSWLFRHHHDIIIAALTGLMFGSLRKVWPWRTAEFALDLDFVFAIIFLILGVLSILLLQKNSQEVESQVAV
ncbi:MAG: DUF368 domain-containing protein [Candidatus Paceibacterota bacterium]